ncbi:MAG: tail fiber domain-containing protein [Bacteroidetes bacterium]|nr:tail fiber domain-containing protein [Bacteroidota bacterium]
MNTSVLRLPSLLWVALFYTPLIAQNVGVGTALPSQRLHVYHDLAKSFLRVETATSDSAGIQLVSDNQIWRISTTGPNYNLNINNGTTLLRYTPGGALLLTGNDLSGVTPASGGGRRFMWIPQKAAIRAGSVTGDNWNADSIGEGSAAFGINNKVVGQASFAVGSHNSVYSSNSFSLGIGTIIRASSIGSIAIGNNASCTGSTASAAIGSTSLAAGGRTFAVGVIAQAGKPSGFGYGHAFGLGAIASGDFSCAVGSLCTSSGGSSLAFGNTVEASGGGAIVIGSGGLNNNLTNSMMLGVNSTTPSITIRSVGTAVSGNVGVGTTNPGVRFQVGETGDGSVAIANAWNVFSDRRLKTDIQPLSAQTDRLLALNTYTYRWAAETADQSQQTGFIAQEVQALFPWAVTENANGLLSVDYPRLVVPLWKTSQELYAKCQALESRLQAIERLLNLPVAAPAFAEEAMALPPAASQSYDRQPSTANLQTGVVPSAEPPVLTEEQFFRHAKAYAKGLQGLSEAERMDIVRRLELLEKEVQVSR